MTRRRRRTIVAALVALPTITGLLALGSWQVQRRTWKLGLIAQVEARIHQPPVAAPGPGEWPAITAASAQYRRVRVEGQFLPATPTLVQALTARGAGWWVLSPLRTGSFTVIVNRGFIADRVAPRPPSGPVGVVGLLRMTEPGGGFLRVNNPASDRWYSRDVAAIAANRRLGRVAPYFIDADAASSLGGPIGGLTVIDFPNNHLAYALTWYTLAVMTAGAFVYFVRRER